MTFLGIDFPSLKESSAFLALGCTGHKTGKFLDKLDHMENILDDLESGFGNKSEGGSKILDLLATHKNLNTDEFKQDIFNVLDMGTESAEKDKLRKILSKDLKEQLSEVSEGLDKIKDLKDISKM